MKDLRSSRRRAAAVARYSGAGCGSHVRRRRRLVALPGRFGGAGGAAQQRGRSWLDGSWPAQLGCGLGLVRAGNVMAAGQSCSSTTGEEVFDHPW